MKNWRIAKLGEKDARQRLYIRCPICERRCVVQVANGDTGLNKVSVCGHFQKADRINKDEIQVWFR